MEKQEIWKDIPDYEGIYQASNLGRIRTASNKTTHSVRHGIRHWEQRILKFKGEEGQAFVTYKCNYLGGDGIIMQEDILDENCSNIVASNYLTIDGGDKINISTGKVETYHIIGFNHGEEEAITVDNVKLEYKYTYA